MGSHRGPPPSPFPSQLDPALPAGRWQGRSAEAAALTWDAQPALSRSGAALRANFGPRQSAGGRRRDSKQGAGPESVPAGVTRPEQWFRGGLLPRDPRLSWARSVVRSPAHLPRHSAPLSRPGWAGLHHCDITSIPGAPPGPAALQVLAILIPSNKARPALPPSTHLQARPTRTFGLGRKTRVSGQTDEWVVAVYCHAPRTRARAHLRVLTFGTRLSLPKAVRGAVQYTPGLHLPVIARTQRRTVATLARLPVTDTQPLSLSSWLSRETHAWHSSLLSAGARNTLRHKVRLCHGFCAPSPREFAHVDTAHTERPPLSCVIPSRRA